MSYSVEIDFAPAYEFIISFAIYVNRSKAKVTYLGTDWLQAVQQQLEPGFVKELSQFRDKYCTDWLTLLVWRSPAPRTPDAFIEWLGTRSAGDLYEHLSPFLLAGDLQNAGDLGGWRNRCVALLEQWNEQYFRTVDPNILATLENDAARKRAMIPATDPQKFAEYVSNGLYPEPDDDLRVVVMTPSYHIRPLNMYAKYKAAIAVIYSVDMMTETPGDPPAHLMNVTRALSDETRLKILRFVSGGGQRFIDIVQHTGLSKSAVHGHLVTLRVAGLIQVHVSYDCTERYSLRVDAFRQLHGHLSDFLNVNPAL